MRIRLLFFRKKGVGHENGSGLGADLDIRGRLGCRGHRLDAKRDTGMVLGRRWRISTLLKKRTCLRVWVAAEAALGEGSLCFATGPAL